MFQDRIARDLLIEAPVDVVWQVITEEEHINGWFTDDCRMDLRTGGTGTMMWGERATKADKAEGETFVVQLQIQTLDPPRRLAYRWGHPQGESPTSDNSFLVEFTLEPEGAHTRLFMAESGISTIAWSDAAKQAYYDEHNVGWDKHLPDLRSYANDRPESH